MEFKMIEKQVFNAMCIAASKITAQILEIGLPQSHWF